MVFRQSFSLFVFGAFCLFLLNSCERKREVWILGFKFPHEHVEVSFQGGRWSPVDSNMMHQPNKVLFFSEQKKINVTNLEFRVKIDSAGIAKLDTLLLIPDSVKNPFISFQHPEQTAPKRSVFTDDKDAHPKY